MVKLNVITYQLLIDSYS